MNFFEIINQLAEVDANVLGRFDSRRAVFGCLGTAARRTALTAAPAFVAALFSKAYAGETATQSATTDVLNYALTLELVEADFYDKMINSSVFANQTMAAQAAIRQIKKHEDAHVALLTRTVQGLGSVPVSGIRFKATAFKATWDEQLIQAQLLEDTGVRAYKGRTPELRNATDASGTPLLTVALQIHSVEARHAAHIRYMRDKTPWVSNNEDQAAHPAYTNGAPGTAYPVPYSIPAYDSAKPSPLESNTRQAITLSHPGFSLVAGADLGAVYSAVNAAAAFDEYLLPREVLDSTRVGGLAE